MINNTQEYQTYIMGKDTIYFDKEILESLKDNMFWWRLSWHYRSNWRVLHIDGFETGIKIPMNMGHTQVFFNYEVSNPKTDLEKDNG
jgi:hypothetical protein